MCTVCGCGAGEVKVEGGAPVLVEFEVQRPQ